jgi:TrpR family trp operon transcriptional repressor
VSAKHDHSEALRELARVLAALGKSAEVRDTLYALLTPRERENLALRWRLVCLLEQGMTQRAIAQALGVSLCKITRGSRELKQGPAALHKAIRLAGRKGR